MEIKMKFLFILINISVMLISKGRRKYDSNQLFWSLPYINCLNFISRLHIAVNPKAKIPQNIHTHTIRNPFSTEIKQW